MSNVSAPVQVSYPGLDRLLDGRYQVIQILETGAWGRTYLAQDTRRPSQPECVIQHIVPAIADPTYLSAFKDLFVREAATLERLGEHGQIPRLLACFEDEQGFHLVQEFVSGDRLTLELTQPLHEDAVLQLLLECLEPLAIVHQDCCRHGDVRPDNLVRRSQDSKLVLINFGTVRDVHRSLLTLRGQSAPSMLPNIQGYQAAEQVQGLPSFASDIYAIGLIGIQALTGVPPNELGIQPETGELLWQPFGETAGSTLRHGLVAVLSRMVRADYTQRYVSAKEALQAIRQLLQAGSASSVVYVTPVETTGIVPVLNATALQMSMPPERPYLETPAEAGVSPAVQIGVGIGAVIAAAVCGYAFPLLLDRTLLGNDLDRGGQALVTAKQQYQAGQLQNAVQLASSIPKESGAYLPAQAAIARWQTDWQTAERTYQAANIAFQQRQWLVVLQQAQKMPQIAYWQQRVKPLIQQANAPAATAAALLLREAYSRAVSKDFAGAIAALKQIPASTAVYAKAQAKLREYVEKQQIQAVSYLQAAYNQAETQNFDQALGSLKQISADTPIYAKAQAKVREYTKKERIRTDVSTPDLNPGSYLQEANLATR